MSEFLKSEDFIELFYLFSRHVEIIVWNICS